MPFYWTFPKPGPLYQVCLVACQLCLTHSSCRSIVVPRCRGRTLCRAAPRTGWWGRWGCRRRPRPTAACSSPRYPPGGSQTRPSRYSCTQPRRWTLPVQTLGALHRISPSPGRGRSQTLKGNAIIVSGGETENHMENILRALKNCCRYSSC